MVHVTKQYPTEDATTFHVFGRVMSGTLYANQEVSCSLILKAPCMIHAIILYIVHN